MISHFLEKTHGNKNKISPRLISGTKAFTLIELMVTVGIFVLMTALILARYNSYYSGTVFTNMAYDVALTIRQAQVYGISVKRDQSNNFTGSYGVYIMRESVLSDKFALYSYSKTSTPLKSADPEKSYTLKRGAKIRHLCVGPDENNCANLDVGNGLDIVFQRPNPEPIICKTVGGTKTCGYKFARIELLPPDGDTAKARHIAVRATGQISIE